MQSKSSFHILVTDTNHHIRDYIKRELEKEGYRVSSINNGIEACDRICADDSVDVLVLDPELIFPYGQSLFSKILDSKGSTRIILHSYDTMKNNFDTLGGVDVVEKNATSIGTLKEIIALCSLSKANGLLQHRS